MMLVQDIKKKSSKGVFSTAVNKNRITKKTRMKIRAGAKTPDIIDLLRGGKNDKDKRI